MKSNQINKLRGLSIAVFAVSVVGAASVACAQNQRQFQSDNNNQGYNQGGNNQGYNNRNFNNNNNNFNNNNFQRRNFDQGGGGYGGFNRRFQNQYAANNAGADDYSVIVEKNIFLRDRRTRVNDPIPTGNEVLTPEQANVITGIIFDDDDEAYHAYVENVAQNGITRLKVGDKIASGQITEIRIDAVAYQKEGTTTPTWVPIGFNLTGRAITSIAEARVGARLSGAQFIQSATPGVTPPPLDPNTAGLSMEERLRLRRAQEAMPGGPPAPPPVQQAPAPTAESQEPVIRLSDNPNTANMSVEERLRLRRQQEQGLSR